MPNFLFFLIFFFLLGHCQTVLADSDNTLRLSLNIPSFTLEVYKNDEIILSYPVAVGKASTPTPTGNYYIQVKETNPTWIPYPEKIVPAGPNNPLGIRWLGFYKTYGLHGTNMPNSIGQAASGGCIRMNNEDVSELYDIVPVGTPFKIVYQVLKIKQDTDGAINLAAFPDIYGWGGLSLSNAYRILGQYGLGNDSVDRDMLLTILREHNGTFTPIGTADNIILYGQKIAEKAITLNHETYLPIIPLLNIASLPVKWNTDKTAFNFYNINYAVRNINEQPYISVDAATSLFEIKIVRQKTDNTIEISNSDD